MSDNTASYCKHEEWTTRKAMLLFREERELEFKVGKENAAKFTPKSFMEQQIQFMLGPKPSPASNYLISAQSFVMTILTFIIMVVSIKYIPADLKTYRFWLVMLFPVGSTIFFLWLSSRESKQYKANLEKWFSKPKEEKWHEIAICKQCGFEWQISMTSPEEK